MSIALESLELLKGVTTFSRKKKLVGIFVYYNRA